MGAGSSDKVVAIVRPVRAVDRKQTWPHVSEIPESCRAAG